MPNNGHPLGVTSKESPAAATTDVATQIGASIATVMAVITVGFVVAAPFAWLIMLFLGNLGLTDVTFWDALPGGGLFGVLVAGRVKA